MSEKKELCESFEECVLSEKELSERLKEHAETCENCRKFLEQYKILDEDLKNFSVEGVDYEKISSSVIHKIRNEKKKSVKFHFSHHVGTAAAVVIILAAALIYGKNPGLPEDNKAVYDVAVTENDAREKNELFSDTQIFSGSKMSKTNEDAEDDAESEKEAEVTEDKKTDTATTALENGVSVYSDEEENAVLDYDSGEENVADTQRSLRKTTSYNAALSSYGMTAGAGRAVSDGSEPQNEAGTETAGVCESLEGGTFEDFADGNAEESVVEQSEEIEAKGFLTSSGGGDSRVENEINAVPEVDKYDEEFHVFDGVEFLVGEENTDYNLLLANARLSELYGDGVFKLDFKCFAFNGWNDGKLFFANADSLTYSDIKEMCENTKAQE